MGINKLKVFIFEDGLVFILSHGEGNILCNGQKKGLQKLVEEKVGANINLVDGSSMILLMDVAHDVRGSFFSNLSEVSQPSVM